MSFQVATHNCFSTFPSLTNCCGNQQTLQRLHLLFQNLKPQFICSSQWGDKWTITKDTFVQLFNFISGCHSKTIRSCHCLKWNCFVAVFDRSARSSLLYDVHSGCIQRSFRDPLKITQRGLRITQRWLRDHSECSGQKCGCHIPRCVSGVFELGMAMRIFLAMRIDTDIQNSNNSAPFFG